MVESGRVPTMTVRVEQLQLDHPDVKLVILLGPGQEYLELRGDGTARFSHSSAGEFSLNLLTWLKQAREASRPVPQ